MNFPRGALGRNELLLLFVCVCFFLLLYEWIIEEIIFPLFVAERYLFTSARSNLPSEWVTIAPTVSNRKLFFPHTHLRSGVAFDRLPSVGTNASTTKSTRTRPNGLKVVKPTFLGRLVSTIASQENESSPRKIPEDSCYLRPESSGTRAQLHFHKKMRTCEFCEKAKNASFVRWWRYGLDYPTLSWLHKSAQNG